MGEVRREGRREEEEEEKKRDEERRREKEGRGLNEKTSKARGGVVKSLNFILDAWVFYILNSQDINSIIKRWLYCVK